MPNEKQEYISNNKGNAVLLSIEFIKSQPPMITHADCFYIWNNKFYEEQTKQAMQKKIFQFFKNNNILPAWQSRKANEMIEAMKANTLIEDIKKIDDYEDLINLNNTMYNLTANKAVPHNNKYYFTYAIHVDYDPAITEHPNFSSFMDDIFRINKNAVDKEIIDLILYIFAYLLYPQIRINKIFIFLGEGANGKTILLNLIQSFFASKYVTSLPLDVISSINSILRNSLSYSKLNLTVEAKVSKKIESEELKKVSEGSAITIRNLYKESANINPKTKIILAAQDFPYFQDTSDGIMRRLSLIEFKNKFVDQHDYDKEFDHEARQIHLAKNEKELLRSLKKEKTAIFNTLLKYLLKLRTELNWVLPTAKNSEDIKEEYRRNADVFGVWLEDNYIVDKKSADKQCLHEILRDFNEYYNLNNSGKFANLSTKLVGRKIKQIFRVDGARERRVINNKMTRLTIYPIIKKNDDEQYFKKSDINPVFTPEKRRSNDDFQNTFPNL